jgi:hypothetical protein
MIADFRFGNSELKYKNINKCWRLDKMIGDFGLGK